MRCQTGGQRATGRAQTRRAQRTVGSAHVQLLRALLLGLLAECLRVGQAPLWSRAIHIIRQALTHTHCIGLENDVVMYSVYATMHKATMQDPVLLACRHGTSNSRMLRCC